MVLSTSMAGRITQRPGLVPEGLSSCLDRASDFRCFRRNSRSLDFNESNAGVFDSAPCVSV